MTRNVLGWWVPSELLDDPNLISTPMPWLSGIALSLQAGVWEESLFRALPLSLLAIWARDREHRRWWLAAGVVATALVFGFAHANYPSWPPYSRGVEIFLSACFWAVLFLWLGLLVTVVAHFTYDLILFGLFAASGSAPAYRLSAAVILLTLLVPALAVAWRWMRQRGLGTIPDRARFGSWKATPVVRHAPAGGPVRAASLTPRARWIAVAVASVALLLEVLIPSPSVLGKPFTVGRDRVLAAADSAARARGLDPARWKRLAATTSAAQPGWARFLVAEDAVDLADTLAATYAPSAWWTVRFVHTGGTAAQRTEEWRIRLWPDGSLLDVHHVVPDSVPGDSLGADQARRVAQAAIAGAGIDTLALRESDLEATDRPARRDVTVTYTDTTMAVPGDAAARVRVTLAGSEPLVVRRSLELPEAFTRAQRERQSTRMIVALVGGILFLALVVGGAVLVIRRRPPVLDDEALGRKASLAVVGFLTVTAAAAALDALPSRLFSYDTAIPWSNWMAINVVATLGAVVPALIALGLWLSLGALRRRVGVPLLPSGPRHGRDVLLAGLGLGAMFTILRLALAASRRSVVPGAPGTTLGEAVPLLTHALSIPTGVVFTVTFVAIPALVVAGIGRRPWTRTAAAVALLTPLLAVALALAPVGASPIARTAEVTGALVVAAGVSVWLWAPYCAWAWLLAGLTDAGFGAIRTAFHAPTGVERAAGVVSLATVIGLAVLLWRMRHHARAEEPDSRRGRDRTVRHSGSRAGRAARAANLALLGAAVVCLSAPVPSATGLTGVAPDGPAGARPNTTRAIEVHEGAADPAVAPDGRRVALSILGKIWTLPVTGGSAEQLTHGSSWDGAPAWSPDGRFLAYAASLPAGTDLMVRDLATGTSAVVTHVDGTIPVIRYAFDGGALYYVDQRGQYEAHVWRIGVDGEGARQLTFTSGWHEWSFALDPRGGRMVLTSGRYGGSDLYLLDTDSLDATRLTVTPAADESSVSWTPDGETLVFVRTDNGVDDVVARPVGEGPERVVTSSPFDQKQISLTPDGRAAVLTAARRLWRVDLATGEMSSIPFTARFQLPERAPAELVVVHARLWDGTGADVVPDATLVVRDGRIAAVGPSGDVPVPEGVDVLDARGRTLLPGLVDNHYHFWSPWQGPPLLARGVTSVRDPGAPVSTSLSYKQAIELGIVAGPHIYTAGPLIDGVGGYHPWVDVELHDSAGGRAARGRPRRAGRRPPQGLLPARPSHPPLRRPRGPPGRAARDRPHRRAHEPRRGDGRRHRRTQPRAGLAGPSPGPRPARRARREPGRLRAPGGADAGRLDGDRPRTAPKPGPS